MVRTSQTHPLRIDSLSVPGCDGRIGLTFCPGKKQANALTGAWDRDLQSDLREIRSWGAEVLVTLMEAHELDALGVPNLGSQAERIGLEWLHLPIVDVGTPDETFESQWKTIGTRLRLLLGSGGEWYCTAREGLAGLGRLPLVCSLSPVWNPVKRSLLSEKRVRIR
jgi:ADP-ribosyl-[dinitrogen reductase] hydrolase